MGVEAMTDFFPKSKDNKIAVIVMECAAGERKSLIKVNRPDCRISYVSIL